MFDCTCSRCQDPTEMGSYLSAIKCFKGCEDGFLLPIDPMNLNSNWHCSICSQENSVDSINETINECFDILYSSKWTLEDCEILLPQLLQKLHPNHNIVLTVKKFLGDLYDVIDKEQIAKKIQCYKDFLDVMIKVDPGYPTWRGQVLYEMHRPMLVQASSNFENGTMSKNKFLTSLQNISLQLEESIKCLADEEDG